MMQYHHRKGFTIVELMIATSVFSVVIVLGLYAFIQINRYYTKGVNIVRTQEATRNLVADIGNQFQLTSGTYQQLTSGSLPNGYDGVCVGNKAYIYKLNSPEATDNHAIYSYAVATNTCPPPEDSTPKTVLLRPGVRLLQLDIVDPYSSQGDGSGPLYNITASLLYAPYDDPDANSAGTDLVDTFGDTNGNIDHIAAWRCKASVSGSEYCSISKINTSVYKRVQ